jgi:quinohemoprotein amine dehydrogenase
MQPPFFLYRLCRPGRVPIRACGAVLAAWAAIGADGPNTKGMLGDGTLYVGAYSRQILAIDEATEKITRIPLKTGFPISVRISDDNSRLYALNSDFERFEIVDVASRQSVDTFTLSEPGRKARVMGFAIEPAQRLLAIAVRTAVKMRDRFQIEPATLLLYDLTQKKVIRSVPWPGDDEPHHYMNMRFSPDGKLLYVFLHAVQIYDTSTLAQVDKWEFSRPIEPGLGRGSLGSADETNDEPGFFTGLFTVEDPVQHRRLLGVGRVDLTHRSVDYFPLGPAPEPTVRLDFTLAPDRTHAYILYEDIGIYQLWVVDVREHRVLQKVQFDGRPRMALRTSTNGKFIYIFEAGNTIDLYDAVGFKYLRTITLDTDMTYNSFHVVPSRQGRGSRESVSAAAAAAQPSTAEPDRTIAASASPSPRPPRPPDEEPVKPNEGFPVTSDIVKQKCASCHPADEKGRLARISFRRTTPEGWEATIKRMVSLDGVKIEPADAHEVLRYLADRQGLAPEEAMPAAFEAERRLIEYHYAGDKDTERTCTACHSMGRVISQRRTRQEWDLVIAMHRGYYPLVDVQAFRRLGPEHPETGGDAHPGDSPPPDSRASDNRHPMDKAVAHLSTAFPLLSSEWTAWSATMRPPRIEGRWALSGYQAGKGPVFGQVVIKPQGGADKAAFTTESTITYARTGRTSTRRGRVLVYTGFQWRGRSQDSGPVSSTGANGDGTASAAPDDWREVLFIDRDWQHAGGRWFTGAYDEFGIDVRLARVGADPIVLGVAQPLIKAGASGQELRLFGANLPARLSPGDLDVGAGITVDRIVGATPDQLTVSVSVDQAAAPGRRSLFIAGATGDASVTVYAVIDFIKVRPDAGLARVGGANFPKQFQQFEAVAYANGPDGLPETQDDVELGPVEASWKLEEFTATYQDDDKAFVGTIDETSGLFTPNLDGPNPKRRNGTNNTGDVWVVATLPSPPSRGDSNSGGVARPLKGRAHLLVTLPLYIKWSRSEISQ